MRITPSRRVFDVELMVSDMVAKGWQQTGLARRADVSAMTVARFFRTEHQTNRTAKKLADALGYSLRRYARKVAA